MMRMTAPTTGPNPSARPTSASARYLGTFQRGSASAAVSISVSVRNSSGRRAARRMPTKPPIDSPTKWHGAAPSFSISAAASSVSRSMS